MTHRTPPTVFVGWLVMLIGVWWPHVVTGVDPTTIAPISALFGALGAWIAVSDLL